MDVSVYLGVEKATMVAQLESWFAEHGLPVLALGGYASQSYVDEVRADSWQRISAYHERNGGGIRDTVLLYAGDFDPSGDGHRPRLHEARTALLRQGRQVSRCHPRAGRRLQAAAGNPARRPTVARPAFVARHGRLVQVELDALDPPDLRDLYERALEPFWDVSAFKRLVAQEREDLDALDGAR